MMTRSILNPHARTIAWRLEIILIGCVVTISLMSALIAVGWSVTAAAHPGGLAADGCNNDRKNGGRHCHGARTAAPPSRPQALRGSAYYPNCAAARAAGAAPVRRGDAGYSSHLDRDGDGVGCE